MERKSSDDEPFSALAFKVATDPFVGTLTFTRVYSGVLTAGSTVFNSVKQKNERVGRMLQMVRAVRTRRGVASTCRCVRRCMRVIFVNVEPTVVAALLPLLLSLLLSLSLIIPLLIISPLLPSAL